MAAYTEGVHQPGSTAIVIPGIPTASRIVLNGGGIVLEQNLTIGATSANVTAAINLKLYWYFPAGTTSVQIIVEYNAALDVSGARPYARLNAQSDLGIALDTQTPGTGAGAHTLTFAFAATPEAGTALFDLIVPQSGLSVDVTWTPQLKPGQSAVFSTGEGGTPVVGAGGAHAFAFIG